MKLSDELKHLIETTPLSDEIHSRYEKRLNEGNLTRGENDQSHVCVYFLPYNALLKKIFIVHHKKSGLWLSPGGHIEQGKRIQETLWREMHEELGVTPQKINVQAPALLTITPIERDVRACKEHFDIWYFIPSDGSDFTVNPDEFHETRWLLLHEARRIVSDRNNLDALDILEKTILKT